ncbi:putative 3-mercaptopyruvate sulfurtransferase [Candidatus Promineifilum breve]|uniref:3-mercaptopyruvate sulfurtransferase n=1 Tax=Candidatus Promineifilum breve TaxID=1806508 RepID=A0A160T1W1_9CHLR|nr:sulfurtransferase [Candidatus Promineifilum breve]CUS02390.2 putative 3-mercaptopyruvate sulfurtransferase [Candidatus Promineifilum breve]
MSDMLTTTIDAPALATRLTDPRWLIVDCRFDLTNAAAGEEAYGAGHIPGAVYAHLERDLSSPMGPGGVGGRHPLPTTDHIVAVFSRWGIGGDTQVVAYDDTSGHYAARLWWMLRFMGHEAVAVLDGGWPAWVAAGLPVEMAIVERARRTFVGAPRWERVATIDNAATVRPLIDGRAPERYRGDVEPIDPVPGHIPGAINRPYAANWTAAGRWRPQEELLGEFLELLGPAAAEDAVFYCGSGVSACVNLLAMAHAGLPDGRLYVGSWSEWSRQNQS